ncbi:hypothetical protein [Nocardia sp. NPDC051750]|uniref:hypothetical protein n=1 Tax=Nocardia sp. NPDC051750 TaxID=3364325 RepID=UPI0037B25B76
MSPDTADPDEFIPDSKYFQRWPNSYRVRGPTDDERQGLATRLDIPAASIVGFVSVDPRTMRRVFSGSLPMPDTATEQQE